MSAVSDDVVEGPPGLRLAEIGDLRARGDTVELPPRPLSGPEYLALPDPPDDAKLLGHYVMRECRTIVVGATGHGKTTLSLQMMRAILAGEPFLGVDGAGNGAGLHVDLEQGQRSIKRSLRDSRLGELDNAYVLSRPDGLNLENADDLRLLEHAIVSTEATVVTVDPWYKAHRGDANEERSVVDLLRRLDELRAAYGFALLMPAHPRKGAQDAGTRKLTVDDVAGSGAITRGAEIVLAIERLAHGYARLRVLKDRDGDLEVGSATNLLYDRELGFRADPKDEEETELLEGRVLAYDGERSLREWTEELGVRRARMLAILTGLCDAGRLGVVIGARGRKLYSTAAIPLENLTEPDSDNEPPAGAYDVDPIDSPTRSRNGGNRWERVGTGRDETGNDPFPKNPSPPIGGEGTGTGRLLPVPEAPERVDHDPPPHDDHDAPELDDDYPF